jgi:hypothetical protein
VLSLYRERIIELSNTTHVSQPSQANPVCAQEKSKANYIGGDIRKALGNVGKKSHHHGKGIY